MSRNSLTVPHFHRQRLLLALIREFGDNMKKTVLYKRLFLFMMQQGRSEYEFFPYKYGCWSLNCENDLEVLSKSGWLDIQSSIRVNKSAAPRGLVNKEDIKQIKAFVIEVKKWRLKRLIRYVYTEYPYYAINSEIAKKNLTRKEMDVVRKSRPTKVNKVLYTIGYEGISFESYVNRLIENNVQLLCDVRKNPLSRKAGFSKRTLETILPKIGIQYAHIPELGIEGDSRRDLNTINDYQKLFRQYTRGLNRKVTELSRILRLLNQHNRVALTCFESEPGMCHRSCVSNRIEKMKPALKVEHI